MRERGDFSCHHEPFNEVYYYGTDRISSRDAEVAPTRGLSFSGVWQGLCEEARDTRVFVKDFAYSIMHMADDGFLDRFQHTFLIRDPAKVLPSIYRHWPDFTPEEAGFAPLHELFDRIAERHGAPPPVITSDDLLDHPAETIEAYCTATGISFMPEALEWDPGKRDEVSWYDSGSWHGNLRSSTGIKRQKRDYVSLDHDPHLLRSYEECLPHYEALLQHRLPVTGSPAAQQQANE